MFKRTLLLASTLLAAFGVCSFGAEPASESSSIVLTNPSFETATDAGGAAGWSGPSSFFVTSELAHSGNACLKWSGDGKKYELCHQGVKLAPGSAVEFSVWVKTKDLVDGRATVCMEWNRQDGSWYGGAYAHGENGTTKDWVKVSCRTRIPDDAISPHITCYVTQDGAGEAWFDDVEISRFFPPLFTAMTTNQYRAQSCGGPVDVYVGYSQTTKDVNFKLLRPTFAISNEDGSAVESAGLDVKLVETTNDCYRFSFDSTALPVGSYQLVCQMVDPNSNKLETISKRFTRLESMPERVSYIDEHLRLIHNGKPFFPLGLYMGGTPKADVELIGDSAFNCVMPYIGISAEEVDNLDAHGVKTIYSVKDNFPGLNSQTMEEGNTRTEKMVAAVKDRPGVIAWYINDELPATMAKDLAARRDQMERLDPTRPTWVVLYQVEELRSYLDTFDVIGTDPYPISTKPASLAAEWTRKTFNAGFGARAVWQVPQIFNWASYKRNSEKSEYRAPTYEEMRGMSWMCIANGANGLIYYSYFDLQRMDKTVEEGGKALVAEPFDVRWGEVKKVAQEIADQFPILLSVGDTLAVKPTDANPADALYRLYGTDEGTWLLVVNSASEPRVAEFALPDGAKVVETRLGVAPEQKGSTLRVELAPLEPRLILVK